jgi:hypothetical protein
MYCQNCDAEYWGPLLARLWMCLQLAIGTGKLCSMNCHPRADKAPDCALYKCTE